MQSPGAGFVLQTSVWTVRRGSMKMALAVGSAVVTIGPGIAARPPEISWVNLTGAFNAQYICPTRPTFVDSGADVQGPRSAGAQGRWPCYERSAC
mmetsp:Transcript_63442/g.102237  ORF Transcript_63442/g.102237 Transcript_63442/m.102237 type:complete len:95 (-) Transcript_63442:260-544(-)